MAGAQLATDLFLVILEKLDLLLIRASLSLLIPNNLVVGLGIRLELLDLRLRDLEATFQLLSLLLELEELL